MTSKTNALICALVISSVTLLSLRSVSVIADDALPTCLDSRGNALVVDDAQFLIWKRSTPNQTLERSHVAGLVTSIYPVRNGHNHFEIQIGENSTDTLEVVYSQSFGPLPPLQIGMKVEACGDYITSNASTSQYPASPDGAIIHWIHRNPGGSAHPSGFLILNGALYGQK